MVTPELGQPQQPLFVEDGAVDMADDDALGRMAACLGEVGDLLRLVGVAAGMDVDGGSRLAGGDQRRLHHALLGVGPRRRAADLADHAGTHVGAPGAVQDLADHLAGKILDRAAVVLRILVVVDVVAAAHDQVHAGAGGDPPEAVGIGREAAAGQLDDGVAALVLHHRHFAGGDVLEIEHVFAAGALQPAAIIDLPDILQGDLGAEIVVGARAGRTDVTQYVFVHQRPA